MVIRTVIQATEAGAACWQARLIRRAGSTHPGRETGLIGIMLIGIINIAIVGPAAVGGALAAGLVSLGG